MPTVPPPTIDEILEHPWQFLLNHREDVVKVFSETPATIVALLVLVAMTAWFLHWVLNKWKIGERDKKITGLEVEIRILERQKADLEIRLKEALEQKLPTALLPTEKPRLQFEFSEAWIERPAPNLWIATVRVKNPTASTILGAFVCIEAIRKIEGINQQDLPPLSQITLTTSRRPGHPTSRQYRLTSQR